MGGGPQMVQIWGMRYLESTFVHYSNSKFYIKSNYLKLLGKLIKYCIKRISFFILFYCSMYLGRSLSLSFGSFCHFNFKHFDIWWPVHIYIMKIRAFLGVPQTRQKVRPKYKGNGHNFGDKFVLAITFYQTHIFRNRSDCGSAFLM